MTAVPDSSRTLSVKPANRMTADTVSPALLPQQAAGNRYAGTAYQVNKITYASGLTRLATAPKPQPKPVELTPEEEFSLLQNSEQQGIPTEHHLSAYTRLAEAGMPEAQHVLMRFYQERNEPQMYHWAQLASAQNSAEAQYCLAYRHSLKPDFESAFKLYRQAAEQGFAPAHWQLGKMYYRGIGMKADPAQAEIHLRQAAEAGFIAAQVMLGDLLAAQNQAESMTWYRKAAAKGSGDAAAALAQHSLTGNLTGRDPLQAMRHTRFAADRRHPEALRIMGDLYRYGLGVKADPHAAHDYYHRAATLGCATAIQKLLSDAALHNPQQYEQIREAALFFQKTEQTFRNAEACHYGIGTAVDYDRARKLYLEAAEFHHKNAAAALGKLYYYGQGVETDFQSAAHWFEIAAEQGHTEAQYYLARLYYHGQGVSSHIPSACRWLQAAISGCYGNPDALRPLLAKWQKEASR